MTQQTTSAGAYLLAEISKALITSAKVRVMIRGLAEPIEVRRIQQSAGVAVFETGTDIYHVRIDDVAALIISAPSYMNSGDQALDLERSSSQTPFRSR